MDGPPLAPLVTGVAERSHALSPDLDLQLHVDDVANLIRWEELVSVILWGHSYGGCVISAVADLLADRIAALVYLDAFLLKTVKASMIFCLPGIVRCNSVSQTNLGKAGACRRSRPKSSTSMRGIANG